MLSRMRLMSAGSPCMSHETLGSRYEPASKVCSCVKRCVRLIASMAASTHARSEKSDTSRLMRPETISHRSMTSETALTSASVDVRISFEYVCCSGVVFVDARSCAMPRMPFTCVRIMCVVLSSHEPSRGEPSSGEAPDGASLGFEPRRRSGSGALLAELPLPSSSGSESSEWSSSSRSTSDVKSLASTPAGGTPSAESGAEVHA
mmetsp:Transcript_29633/g.81434  ORF Transcript_29633/g.81434 Transcript_29633/m.81434 type:complete len:205 (+) Transcript_29633:686-1300(+)